MFRNISAFFLLGLAAKYFINADLFFSLFLMFCVFLFLYIKDMSFKDIKDILSFVLYAMSFIFAGLYLSYFNSNNIDNFPYETPIQVTGRVLEKGTKSGNNFVSLKVMKLENYTAFELKDANKLLLNIPVSPFSRIQIGDMVSAEVVVKQTRKNIYLEGRPIIFSNEREDTLGRKYLNVSDVRNITVSRSTDKYFESNFYTLFNIGETVLNRVDSHMHEPYSTVAKGISFGIKENFSNELIQIFRDSGLIHILVLSGANMSFIILLVFYLLKKIEVKKKIIFTLSFAWLFVFITGFTAPSLRATIMISFVICSEYFGKRFKYLDMILYSLLFLSLLNPNIIFNSASLHLTYLAFFGVTIVPKILERTFLKLSSKKSNILIFYVCLFLGIVISIFPYLFAMTGKVNLIGVAISFILEPIIWTITVLTFSITLLSYFSNFLANILGALNSAFVDIVLKFANIFSDPLFSFYFNLDFKIFIIYYAIYLVSILYFSQNDIIDERFQKSKS
jgi:competence protein ComEC